MAIKVVLFIFFCLCLTRKVLLKFQNLCFRGVQAPEGISPLYVSLNLNKLLQIITYTIIIIKLHHMNKVLH